jgi:hypothetical protein
MCLRHNLSLAKLIICLGHFIFNTLKTCKASTEEHLETNFWQRFQEIEGLESQNICPPATETQGSTPYSEKLVVYFYSDVSSGLLTSPQNVKA